MAKRGKKYQDMIKDFENKEYNINKAIKIAKKTSYSNFTGTISAHFAIKLPKDKDAKSIKGSLTLPNPVQQAEETRIIVFCEKGDAKKAKEAGAVEAGLDDLVEKIENGWSDFDIALAVPPVMGKIAVLGRYLGPKGLMPNPKTGTLVDNMDKMEETIKDFLKGKTYFKCDESAVIHIPVGKTDKDDKEIKENILKAFKDIATTVGKPAESLYKSVHISPTMGAGVEVEISSLLAKEE